MEGIIEFPNLFSDGIKIDRVMFSFFGLEIYWYGVLITTGVILGMLIALKKATRFGMIEDNVFDTAFVSAIGGFIGARAYYCIFHNLNPDNAVKYTLNTAVTGIRDGGLAIYGGIIGSVLVCVIFTRIKKYRLLPILDLAGLSFPVGQAIGRWGNFVNQEAYGGVTDLPWGMTGNRIASDPYVGEGLVHPCFLYESLWCFVGFLILLFYSKKLRSFDGEIFLMFVAWYGAGRSFIESFRTDSLYWGDFRISQVVGLVTSFTALILFLAFKIGTANKIGYKMYVETEESKTAIYEYGQAILMKKEKAAAVKAMKKADNRKAPSILGDTSDDDSGNDESITDNREDNTENE